MNLDTSSNINAIVKFAAFHEFEGISGVFIVRTTDDAEPNRDLYDFDLYSHVIHIADWMHVMEDNKYPGANRDESLITEKADSYLINGLGTYQFGVGIFLYSMEILLISKVLNAQSLKTEVVFFFLRSHKGQVIYFPKSPN